MVSIKPLFQSLRKVDFALSVQKLFESRLNNSQMPQLKVEITTIYKEFKTDTYEVALVLVCKPENQDDFFNILCEYSGVFEIKDYPDKSLDAIINGYCAGFIFPFLRAKIAQLSVEAGLQPIMLDPIDFYAAYKQNQEDK